MKAKAAIDFNAIKYAKEELVRFMMPYKLALDEVNTKIDILKQELQHVNDYNPIEHVKSRLKSPNSILRKADKKGYDLSLTSIKENIRDIAGVRITCSFMSDIYLISEMLQKQKDMTVVDCKDYIQTPKPNGYRSLHFIIQVPVLMSHREDRVFVEIQIRTIAMDVWASLEHKIYYKYDGYIPKELKDELTDAALSACQLDEKMEAIHKEVNQIKKQRESSNELASWISDDYLLLPPELHMKQWRD